MFYVLARCALPNGRASNKVILAADNALPMLAAVLTG